VFANLDDTWIHTLLVRSSPAAAAGPTAEAQARRPSLRRKLAGDVHVRSADRSGRRRPDRSGCRRDVPAPYRLSEARPAETWAALASMLDPRRDPAIARRRGASAPGCSPLNASWTWSELSGGPLEPLVGLEPRLDLPRRFAMFQVAMYVHDCRGSA
jgi:hypothetical protein